MLLAVVTTANAWAQRGKRAIERIDRDVQTRVFIPKGTWMAGGTVSYSEHEQDNLNFLVIKDVEGNGYDFSISPYIGYFFRNNMAAGIRFLQPRLPRPGQPGHRPGRPDTLLQRPLLPGAQIRSVRVLPFLYSHWT